MLNNQQITDPSLTSIQSVLSEEKPNKENKLSPEEKWKYIIKMCVCLVTFFFLFWVYYKWMTIPIRKHYIQLEHLASADSSANICANVIIDDIKSIAINDKSRLPKSINSKNSNNSLYNTTYLFQYKNSKYLKYKQTYPIKRNYTGSLSEIIGQNLYDELNDTCQKHNLDLSRYHTLFYFRHIDNEKYARGKVSKHKITVTGLGNDTTITISGVNDRTLQNYQRDSLLHINHAPFFRERIDETKIKQKGYYNITEGYVLCPNEKDLISLNVVPSVDAINNIAWFFTKVFLQMEDISQSYYEIEFNSPSIPETTLKMEFTGTINCIQDSSYARTNWVKNRVETDRSSVTIKTDYSIIDQYLFLVKFNDMQNMQTMRLFILAALITLTLTTMIKTIVKLLEPRLMPLLLPSKAKSFKKKKNESSNKKVAPANSASVEDSDATV